MNTLNIILRTVAIHGMMMKTLFQTTCVVFVVEVILPQIWEVCSVQIQTMGP